MSTLGPQTENNVPETDLAQRLSQVWLKFPPKPSKITMTRQADGSWNVTMIFD
jgi:hypothetical protein